MLYNSIHKLKFKLESEKTARLQKNILETAKKHNLEILKHSDDPLEHRHYFSRWIKSLRTMLLCFPKFSNVIFTNNTIYKLPDEMISENHMLTIYVILF